MAKLSVAGGALTHRLGLVSGSGIEMPKEGLEGPYPIHKRSSRPYVTHVVNETSVNDLKFVPASLTNLRLVGYLLLVT